jgi:hypothetical protein
MSDEASIWLMDWPAEPRRFARTRLGSPSSDPPGWVDGAPTSRIGQSCAFCGTRNVVWVHPLARDRLTFREFGEEHTLPTFWSLCDRCEEIYAAGDDDAAVEVMRSSSWSWVDEEDVGESIRQPLAVFRRADLGARRFEGPEPPRSAVTGSEG